MTSRTILSNVSVAALFGAGAVAIGAPAFFSRLYGFGAEPPNETTRGFARALGARDMVIAAITLQALVRDDRTGVRTALALASVLALVDFAVVATSNKRAPLALVTGESGAIFALLIAAATRA